MEQKTKLSIIFGVIFLVIAISLVGIIYHNQTKSGKSACSDTFLGVCFTNSSHIPVI